MRTIKKRRISRCKDSEQVTSSTDKSLFDSWYYSASSRSRKTVIDFLMENEGDAKRRIETIC
jgi:hypothetical protein